jgi:hypothetical protein
VHYKSTALLRSGAAAHMAALQRVAIPGCGRESGRFRQVFFPYFVLFSFEIVFVK